MNYKIVCLWELAYMCGHFQHYSPKARFMTSLGEIAVVLQHYGFKGSYADAERILACIERCRGLIGVTKPLSETEKASALKNFALAVADKALDYHYALGGSRWTEVDEDDEISSSMERYYYWSDRPSTVAKMAVARFMLDEA